MDTEAELMNKGYKGWFLEWIEEWSQLLGGCNWYTFTPIKIEFEDDRILGGFETTWVILGLGFRIRWNHTETDAAREITDAVDELLAE